MHCLQIVILVTLAACVHGVVNAKEPHQVKILEKSQNMVLNANNNLTNTEHDALKAEEEERWKVPGFNQLSSYFRKKPEVVNMLKENPALAKTLTNNPALAKSFHNNPQLSKTFQEVQKDTALIKRIKSFEKDPAASKLKTALGKNPSGLTEKSVTKLGAVVSKSSTDQGDGILFICGLMLLLILVGGLTVAVVAPNSF
ncbi:Hypothetical protein PHPALM_9789 [Phytophthora palmivora]|uniref:RxLR effector n=1 Tax=Phytophthora palmivora TaxID=4796 RepID=A0A2P4Y6R0_9STRA|nr:Hypothetical protein PHPALM_9789 [Phytophthora palmivora]